MFLFVPIVLAVRIVLVVLVVLVKRCSDQSSCCTIVLVLHHLELAHAINCDSYASEAQGG